MSNLVDHARRELELCGQYKEDPLFAQSLVAAVAAFASYPGHSGSSAEIGIEMLADLLRFKNLSPLTDDPEEWFEHAPGTYDGTKGVWQNVRNGAAFSEDGGKTYYRIDEPKNEDGGLTVHTSVRHVEAAVSESIDHGEAYGVASASMAEPSDFFGGQTDAVVGYRCTCGEIHREGDPVWQESGHGEVK